MESILDGSHAKLDQSPLHRLRLVYFLNDNMALVNDSVQPPATIDPNQKQITWDRSFLDTSQFTATLRVMPLQVGRNSIGEGSVVDFMDLAGRAGQALIRPVHVNAFQAFGPRRP